MTDAHARAVEKAALALLRRDHEPDCGLSDVSTQESSAVWEDATTAITAYLDAMRADGWVMVRVPAEVEPRFQQHQQWVDGFNFCRTLTLDSAAMLKGAGDEQG